MRGNDRSRAPLSRRGAGRLVLYRRYINCRMTVNPSLAELVQINQGTDQEKTCSAIAWVRSPRIHRLSGFQILLP